MTRLTSELKELGHTKCACPYPYFSLNRELRRLYIRQGRKGKQKFVPWGIICLGCGYVFSKQVIRQVYS